MPYNHLILWIPLKRYTPGLEPPKRPRFLLKSSPSTTLTESRAAALLVALRLSWSSSSTSRSTVSLPALLSNSQDFTLSSSTPILSCSLSRSFKGSPWTYTHYFFCTLQELTLLVCTYGCIHWKIQDQLFFRLTYLNKVSLYFHDNRSM